MRKKEAGERGGVGKKKSPGTNADPRTKGGAGGESGPKGVRTKGKEGGAAEKKQGGEKGSAEGTTGRAHPGHLGRPAAPGKKGRRGARTCNREAGTSKLDEPSKQAARHI